MKKIKLLIAIILVISFALIMPNVKAQQICFEPVVNIQLDTTTYPYGITSDDFNGDGNIDLAVADYTNSNDIVVLLGTGTGDFGSPVYFNVGSPPKAIISADFNGDSIPDLAVANTGVSVLLGTGSGSFAPAVNYLLPNNTSSITSADFNGDNILDLATGNYGSYNMAIFLGNGDGSFGTPNTFPMLSPVHPTGIVSNDFNKDSIPDLAVSANPGVPSAVNVFLGIGDGSFDTVIHYPATEVYSIASEDFNGDGFPDLVTGHLSVLLNNGDGSFGAETIYTGGIQSICCADFNNDGNVDIASAGWSTGNVYMLQGNGDGSFGNETNYPINAWPDRITCADFNGDGLPDLATTIPSSSSIAILINCTETSINQLYIGKEKITVYPNPANERLVVKTGNNSRMFLVSMYDMLGNKIISTKEKEIDIRTLQNGIYLVKVETGESVQIRKIVIQK